MRQRFSTSKFRISIWGMAAVLAIGATETSFAQESEEYRPKRINKCIELLEKGQPIYYEDAAGGYDAGLALADTWADYLIYDMEHNPFDLKQLREFMQGLVDGGPTPSGHRTPTVIVNLPVLGLDEATYRAGSWVAQQVLAQGVHGLHLCHARDPEAVRAYVQSVRYPIHKQKMEEIGEGLRGYMSQRFPAKIWGIDDDTYIRKADVWPLNPDGEIMLGLKIEDRHALANVDQSLKVPGICFAEWGPRDMGLSYGYLGGQADPPFPKEMREAGEKVLQTCKENNIFFLDNVLPSNVVERIEEGVMIGAGRKQESAEVGRKATKREMPW